MFRLRKGDLWKAVALAAATVVPVFFIVRTLIAASRLPGAAAHPTQIAQSAEPGQAAGATGEPRPSRLFAERPRTPMADVGRARIAPDPFRPYASARPASEQEAGGASEETRAPSPLPSELDGLRLTGVISGTREPLAALTDGSRHYYVSVGETLPGGWRLVRIGGRTVTLTKDGQNVEVELARPPRPGRQ
jgi:hypothetical protein